VIVQDLSEKIVIDSLSDYLNNIETRRTREREYLLDFYEGFNVEDYVGKYFASESLQQVPMFTQNLTRRVCKARGMAYKRPRVWTQTSATANTLTFKTLILSEGS